MPGARGLAPAAGPGARARCRPDAAARPPDRDTLARESARRPARRRAAPRAAGAARHRPAGREAAAAPVRSHARRAVAPRPLEAWAGDTGASPRTIARLFRSELGTTFVRWREQVLLARAVPLAARSCRWRRSPPSSAMPARAPSPPWSSARSALADPLLSRQRQRPGLSARAIRRAKQRSTRPAVRRQALAGCRRGLEDRPAINHQQPP